jgi:hypothetical protein
VVPSCHNLFAQGSSSIGQYSHGRMFTGSHPGKARNSNFVGVVVFIIVWGVRSCICTLSTSCTIRYITIFNNPLNGTSIISFKQHSFTLVITSIFQFSSQYLRSLSAIHSTKLYSSIIKMHISAVFLSAALLASSALAAPKVARDSYDRYDNSNRSDNDDSQKRICRNLDVGNGGCIRCKF